MVLGISTGGPQALKYLIPQLPADFPAPIVVVHEVAVHVQRARRQRRHHAAEALDVRGVELATPVVERTIEPFARSFEKPNPVPPPL